MVGVDQGRHLNPTDRTMADEASRSAQADPDVTEAITVPVTPQAGDRVHSVLKAALGMVPVAGAALQEIFVNIWMPPLERRRAEWMETITARLHELDQQGRLDLRELTDDQAFVTLMLDAGNAAVRTHEREKVEALRNAVLNSACIGSPGRNLELQFVALINQLSGWHLRLLALLGDPRKILPHAHPLLTQVLRSIIPVVEWHIPELREKPDVVRQLYEDLFSRRLVALPDVDVRPGFPALGKRTTTLGDEFLTFIITGPAIEPDEPRWKEIELNVPDPEGAS